MTTILVTGFGPFPGAPFNPTGPLVQRLSKLRLPRTTIVTHVFETSYAAVDRDLPKLLKRHRADAVLMFGLAVRSRIIRIETRAQNGLAVRPDAAGKTPRRKSIVRGPVSHRMVLPARALLAAVRNSGVRARLSRDAGLYLCNYLCWHATMAATAASGGPRLAAFVHVPLIADKAEKKRGKNKMTLDDLTRAGAAVLRAVVAAAERAAPLPR